MKKFAYFFTFMLAVIAFTTCESDSRFTTPDVNGLNTLSVQKEILPAADAKCPPCSEETAWAAGGGRYNSGTGGNWATYIHYTGAFLAAPIYAGQYMYMGTAVLAPVPGGVHIDIVLFGDWCFRDDEPVKIEGYNSAPSGNPKPGLFTYYKGTPEFEGLDVDGRVYHVGVFADVKHYYGIHLDMGCCEE